MRIPLRSLFLCVFGNFFVELCIWSDSFYKLFLSLMLKRYSSALVTASLLTFQVFVPVSAAIQVRATCDGPERCDAQIAGNSITTSSGISINTDNVITWGFVNDNSVGGFIKMNNEDYRILIKYFDDNGNRKLSQIGFYNFKTAQTFVNALEIITGLAPDARQSNGRLECTGFSLADGVVADSSEKSLISEARSLGSAVLPFVGFAAGPAAGVATYAGASVLASDERGTFELERNFVSEIRKTPAASNAFMDASFDGRRTCKQSPSINSGTNITVNN